MTTNERRNSAGKVYFITGAGRGMGVDLARAALAAGHQVVATARRPEAVKKAVGADEKLLAVKLDITDPAQAEAAVRAAVERFGRIDVLINNAASFQAGFFEEVSPEQFRAQMEVNFFGALNVTRAVLPVMRQQRGGQIVAISLTAGVVAGEFEAAYAASKFALEGGTEAANLQEVPYSGQIVFTDVGTMSVQAMNPDADAAPTPYTVNGYEAFMAAWPSMRKQKLLS